MHILWKWTKQFINRSCSALLIFKQEINTLQRPAQGCSVKEGGERWQQLFGAMNLQEPLACENICCYAMCTALCWKQRMWCIPTSSAHLICEAWLKDLRSLKLLYWELYNYWVTNAFQVMCLWATVQKNSLSNSQKTNNRRVSAN